MTDRIRIFERVLLVACLVIIVVWIVKVFG